MILSRLYVSGPESKMIKELIIRLNGYAATARNPDGSITRKATHMLIVIAIAAGRVKNPIIKNKPPRSSVNMLR
jgi:hypothetical protein